MISQYRYWRYKNILPKHLCNDIISFALNKNVVEGSIGGPKPYLEKVKKYKDNSIRNSNLVWLDEKWLYNKLFKIIQNANIDAKWNFEINNAEPVQFTIYKEGMHYDWHEDQFERPYERPNDPLNGKTRKLSLSLLLNDPKEYRGGDFEVDFGNRQKPIKTIYELNGQGDCIIFPSDLLHRVRPVTEGIRYSLVMWTLGDPFR